MELKALKIKTASGRKKIMLDRKIREYSQWLPGVEDDVCYSLYQHYRLYSDGLFSLYKYLVSYYIKKIRYFPASAHDTILDL